MVQCHDGKCEKSQLNEDKLKSHRHMMQMPDMGSFMHSFAFPRIEMPAFPSFDDFESGLENRMHSTFANLNRRMHNHKM